MISVRRGNQLGSDADLSARLPNAAFEDVGHTQRRADLRHVLRLALEGERGRPRRDAQAGDAGQGVQDFLREPIREVVVGGIGAHVHEGQHRDGSRGGRHERRRGRCPRFTAHEVVEDRWRREQ